MPIINEALTKMRVGQRGHKEGERGREWYLNRRVKRDMCTGKGVRTGERERDVYRRGKRDVYGRGNRRECVCRG